MGKLAVSIEKEMFNLYMNTDNKYKNKYRSLMFNLKDPKNKVSFFLYINVSETIINLLKCICNSAESCIILLICVAGPILSCGWWRDQSFQVSETESRRASFQRDVRLEEIRDL